MRTATWISDNGTTVHFDNLGPYYFRRLTDSAGATAETVRAPRQPGQTTHHVSLDRRSIVLEGQMYTLGGPGRTVEQQREYYRDHLLRAFLPNTWGLLVYHTEEADRQIRARAVARPAVIEDDNPALCGISVDLITDGALWESTKLYTFAIGGVFRMWRFPWVTTREPMGAYKTWGWVDNGWVEEIYPTIEVYSTAKTVTITNETTGGFLRVEHPIEAAQKMVVDMEEMYALLYGRIDDGYVQVADVTHWITLESAPWGLLPGRNRVKIENDDDTVPTHAYLMYRSKYGGV